MTAMVDAIGQRTAYSYAAPGRLSQIVHPDGSLEVVEAVQTRALVTWATDKDNLAQPYTPDDLVGRVVDRAGKAWEYRTDRYGNVLSETDSLGRQTEYLRDRNGQPIFAIEPDPDGNEGPQKGPEHAPVRQLSYNFLGTGNGFGKQLTRISLPDGTVREWAYDDYYDRVTSYTDELGRKTSYGLHPLTGNIQYVQQVVGEEDSNLWYRTLAQEVYFGGVTGVADDVVTSFLYTDGSETGTPPKGLVKRIVDANVNLSISAATPGEFYFTDLEYDGEGKITKITFPKTANETTAPRMEFAYDTNDNLMSVTEFTDEFTAGRKTTYTYDNLNRLTATQLPDPDVLQGTAGPAYRYVYDQLNRLIAAIDPTPTANNPPTAPPQATEVNVTDAVAQSVIDLGAIFDDDHDADSALTYTVLDVGDPALFDAVAITQDSPPRLVLDYAGGALTPPTGVQVTVRATDTEGEDTSHTLTVHRNWPAGHLTANAEFIVNSATADVQNEAVVAALAGGGFVTVWKDANGDDAILARRFNEMGGALGDPVFVDDIQPTTVTEVSVPTVVGTGDGGFIVSWWRKDDLGNWHIYMRRYDNQGAALAAAELVYSTEPGTDDSSASIAVLNDGRYVVTWSSNSTNPATNGYDVFARVFEAIGTPVTGAFVVATSVAGSQSAPTIAATKDGGFSIVWHGNGPGEDTLGVYMRHYDADLNPWTTELQVNAESSGRQTVAVTPDGAFVVVWAGTSGPGDSSAAIVARLFGADGTPASDDILVNHTTANVQNQPSVATTADGGFVVTWQGNGAGDGTGVFLRRFRRNGTPIDVSPNAEILVNTTTTGAQLDSSVAVNEDGAVVVVWSGEGTGDADGVFARLVPAFEQGNHAGGPFRVLSVTPGQSVHGPVDRALVQFSEPIHPDSFEAMDFTLLDPNGTAVTLDGTPVQISQTQWLALFTNDVQVRPGNYSITVGNQIENADSSVTSLVAAFQGAFYLAPGVPTAPYLTTSDPINFNLAQNSRATIDLTQYFTDDQDGPHGLTYSVVGVGSGHEAFFNSITLPSNRPGIMLVDLADNAAGSPQITVRATDSDNSWVEADITLVINVNEFLINEYNQAAAPDRAQLRPMIAATDDGGYVATWLEYDTDAPNNEYRIMARRFDGGGNPLTGDIEVQGPMDSYSYAYPTSVAVTKSGYFVVTWHQDDGAGDGGFNVYFRRMWLDGTPLDGDRRLITTTGNKVNNQYVPMAAATPNGGFIVTFYGGDADTTSADIYYRRFDGDGNPLGDQQIANTITASGQFNPSIAVAPDGRFIIAWHGYNPTDLDVYSRMFDAEGNPPNNAPEVVLNTTIADNQTSTDVAYLDTGEWIVVWDSYESGTYEIRGRMLEESGTAQGLADWRVNVTTVGNQRHPEVAAEPDGGFTVAWYGYGTQTGPPYDWGHGIHARRFNSEGEALDAEDQLINVYTSGNQYFTDIITLADRRLGYIWEGEGPGDQTGVFGIFKPGAAVDPGPFRVVGIEVPPVLRGSVPGVLVTFSEPVDAATLEQADIIVNKPNGGTIAIDSVTPWVQISATGWLAKFADPQAMLDAQGQYFIVIGPNIANTDVPGELLDQDQDGTPGELGDDEFESAMQYWTTVNTILDYDAASRVATAWDALGNRTHFGYTRRDELMWTTDPLGRRSHFTYDTRGLLSSVSLPDADGTGGPLHQFQYDFFGNLSKSIDPLGNETEYGYNAIHELVRIFQPNADPADPNYRKATDGLGTSFGPVTKYAYDAARQITSVTDPLGRETRYNYDTLGRLTYVAQEAPNPAVLPYDNIINDTAATLVPASGSFAWSLVEQTPAAQNSDYHETYGNGVAKATWEFSNLTEGTAYEVFVTWYTDNDAWSLYSPDVEYEVFDGTASEGVFHVNQQRSPFGTTTTLGPSWHRLGVFTADNTTMSVELTDGSQPADFMIADAVRFVEVGPVTRYEYDAVGNLTRMIMPDPDGAGDLISPETTYAYDQRYRLSSITLPDPDKTAAGPGPLPAPVWQYVHDGVGRLTTLIDPLNRKTDYEYDFLDRLKKTLENDPLELLGTNRPETAYQYDPIGNMTHMTDPLGRTRQYTYDRLYRPVAAVDPAGGIVGFGYDGASNLTSRTDQLGRTSRFAYDALNRLTTRTLPDPDAGGPLASPVTSYQYDAVGNLTGMIQPARDIVGQTGVSPQTQYAYDALNRLIEVRQPDPATGAAATGPLTTYSYDAASQLTKLTAPARPGPAGVVAPETEYRYDNLGRLSDVFAANPATGLATSGGLPIGPVTHFDYDLLSRRTQVVAPDPDGTGGNLLSPVTSYEYDALGRMTVMTEPDPDDVAGQTGPLGRPLTTYAYDAASQLVTETDPLGRTIDYGYDYLGRATSVTRQLGDPLEQLTTYEFDAVGNLLTLTEPDPGSGLTSPITRYTYDALDRRTGILDAREGETRFSFDAVGNLTSLTDPVQNTTFFAYDRLNRQTAETVHLSDTPGAAGTYASRTFAYNAAGQLTQKSDRLGRVTKYAYDALGRGRSEVWFADEADPTPDRTLNFTFDNGNQLTSASDPAAAYDFEFDYLGRTKQVTHDLGGMADNVVFDQLFDDLGRRTELAATIGATADFRNEYQYDALSRMTRVTQEGQVGGNWVNDKRVDFTYNAIGQFTSITRYKDLAGGAANEVATTTFGYDVLARLTDLDHTKPDQTLISGYDYTFDRLNRISGMDFTNSAYDAEDVTFSYDATDQLISANRTGTTSDESYVHDLNGNRDYDGYESESHNRMSSDGTYTYTYDVEGNRTAKFIDSNLIGVLDAGDTDVTLYEWDHRNRLVKVTTQAMQGVNDAMFTFEYDVFNNRVAKHSDTDANGLADGAEYWVWDGMNPVLHFIDPDGDGAQPAHLSRRLLYGAAADSILAAETNGLTLWHLTDHLGTTRDLIDDDGTISLHYEFDSFGRILTPGNLGTTLLFFTGRWYDPDLSLYYIRARWYDPATARWISDDPIGFAAGDTNLHRYVGNSPTNFVDPSGLASPGQSSNQPPHGPPPPPDYDPDYPPKDSLDELFEPAPEDDAGTDNSEAEQLEDALEMAKLAAGAYKGNDPNALADEGWEVLRVVSDEKTGFRAVVFRNSETGEVVLSFSGTDDLEDWRANFCQGVGLRDWQYERAVELARELKEQYGDDLRLTGHSLGGGLASAAAIVNDVPAITFNPAGVHKDTVERYGAFLITGFELIVAYLVRLEPLSTLQDHSLRCVPVLGRGIPPGVMPDTAGRKRRITGRGISPIDKHSMNDVLTALEKALEEAKSRDLDIRGRGDGPPELIDREDRTGSDIFRDGVPHPPGLPPTGIG